jgi:hypothetical protein
MHAIFSPLPTLAQGKFSHYRRTVGYCRKSIRQASGAAKRHANCRVHQSIRVSPAVEAGIADHMWTLSELLSYHA